MERKNIKLNSNEIDLILSALSELPYKISVNLINNILIQIQENKKEKIK